MIGLVLAFILSLAPALSWAANTSISNGESGASVRDKLNRMLDQQFNIKQPPYNAKGDNSTDDFAAIQHAINDACDVGGAVYLPPGTYNIYGKSLVFDQCITGYPGKKIGISLVGAGVNMIAGYGITTIRCNLVGFCVDKHSVVTATGAQFAGGLMTVDSLMIANANSAPSGGALRMEGTQPGITVNNCMLTGGTGLVMIGGTFQGSVSNCTFNSSNLSGTVGIYAAQIQIRNVRIVGFGIGIVANATTTMSSIATEVDNIGIVMGWNYRNVFYGYIDDNSTPGTYSGRAGNVLTVLKYAFGTFDQDDGSGAGGHGPGIHGPGSTWADTLDFSVCPICNPAGLTITGQSTTTQPGGFNGGTGTYSLGGDSNVPPQTLATDFRGLSSAGASITGWQTERLNTGLVLAGFASSTVQDAIITGGIGAGINISTSSNATWASADGGTLTFVLDRHSFKNGARACFAESFEGSIIPTGYNFDQSTGFNNGVNCQWADTTVRIRGVDNPAAPLNGNIPNPGTNSSTHGVVSANQDACIVFGTTNRATIRDVSCGTTAVPELDFSGFGQYEPSSVTLENVKVVRGANQPPHGNRANVTIRNSTGFGEVDMQVLFGDLPAGPGHTNVYTPNENEEHLIVDALAGKCSNPLAPNTAPTIPCSIGSVVSGGGGALHRKVRWNGSNWTVVGQ